jgi:hypothetical protein
MSFLKRLTVLFPMLGIVACVASGCNQTPQSQIALQPDSAPEASASAATGRAGECSSDSRQSAHAFVDVAAQAGLKYRWVAAGKRPLNILQVHGQWLRFSRLQQRWLAGYSSCRSAARAL